MKLSRQIAVLAATLFLLPLFAITDRAAAGPTSLTADARGKGTLTVGKEVFNVTNVIVKLKEDGTGEIMLITDLTLFFNCTWSANAELSQGIDLKLTARAGAGPEASGKLLLRPDGKSIASLMVAGTSSTLKRKVRLNFVAD
jgi:hypothetical protein